MIPLSVTPRRPFDAAFWEEHRLQIDEGEFDSLRRLDGKWKSPSHRGSDVGPTGGRLVPWVGDSPSVVPVAQLEEQSPSKRLVGGSTPSGDAQSFMGP